MAREYAEAVDALLRAALDEDLGTRGDVTSTAIFSEDESRRAVIALKAEGVVSGVTLIAPLFAMLDNRIKVNLMGRDGDRGQRGTRVAELEGPIRGLLAGERTVLNLLQHLSGIATATSDLVACIAGHRTRLLDTRKTTPTIRFLEKRAVVHGGGFNHRFGLYDMVLIKDTHVKAAGGVGAALRKVKDRRGERSPMKIEAEVQTLDEFHEALREGPDRIMLDNMGLEDLRRCVAHVRSAGLAVELEASGNITAETIRDVAATGVDFISVGCITHSAPALDIHMVIES